MARQGKASPCDEREKTQKKNTPKDELCDYLNEMLSYVWHTTIPVPPFSNNEIDQWNLCIMPC